MSIRPAAKGVKQAPPLKILVEMAEHLKEPGNLAERIEHDIRATLVFSAKIELVPAGALPRSEYKSKLLDFSEATVPLADDAKDQTPDRPA